MTINPGPKLSAERPFPGLRPFDYIDSDYFFGREDQIYALYRLLDGSRFIAVVGSSGSGKSSLVRAGLRPLLDEESRNEGGRSWRWVEMRPGGAPLENLANNLAALSGEAAYEGEAIAEVRRGRILDALRESSLGLTQALADIDGIEGETLVIVVDQFEELFRYAATGSDPLQRAQMNARWRDEAAHFVQLLQEAARDREKRFHVLITLRSDFIGECAQFHGLPEAVSATQFLTPSLTRDQRQEVICEPIDKADGDIEPALVQCLLNEATDEPDQLPVLQHCLMRLWARTQRERVAHAGAIDEGPSDAVGITLTDYDSIGRVAEALSRHADEVMDSLPGQAKDVELVFRALSEIDAEGRAIRRPLAFEQLMAETGIEETALRRVIDRFRADDCSFLVPSPSSTPVLTAHSLIDVGHEALLRRWEKISAKRAETLEDGQAQTGWLAAENEDSHVYRGLLALANAGPKSILQDIAERWTWWRAPGRTQAWANRYGGHFEKVQQLLENNLEVARLERLRIEEAAASRRRVRALLVISALVVIAIFGWEWHVADRAEHEASVERNALLNQLATTTFDVSEQLRYVPGSRAAVQEVLNGTTSFSKAFANGLKSRKVGDKDSASATRVKDTAEIATGLYQSMFGFPNKAIDGYSLLLKPGNSLGVDKLAGPGQCSLWLLRAQALMDRGQAYLQIAKPALALQDFKDAEAAVLDPRHRKAGGPFGLDWLRGEECFGKGAGHDEAMQDLATAASGEINADIAASDATGANREVAELTRELSGHDAGDPFWSLMRAQLAARQGDLAVNIKDYGHAIAAYDAAIDGYDAIVHRENSQDGSTGGVSYTRAAITARYYRMKRADAVVQSKPDAARLQQARADLEAARTYYDNLLDLDPSNAYWLQNAAIAYRALGDAATDQASAIENYSRSEAVARKLAHIDDQNPRRQQELATIRATLARAEAGGSRP